MIGNVAAQKGLLCGKMGQRCVVWELSINCSADSSGFSYPSVIDAEHMDVKCGNKYVAVEYDKKTVRAPFHNFNSYVTLLWLCITFVLL